MPRLGACSALAAALVAAAPAACAAGPGAPAPEAVEELAVEVLASVPHDPQAFTQGLVWSGGALYESTGRYGESSLRRVDPATGAALARVDLPPDLFGEGLALVPGPGQGRLVQLTWLEGVARVWDAATLEPAGSFRYQGEGWGLCFDGERLVMSDGSDALTLRDPVTFEVTGTLAVTLRGRPLERLNELECAEGWVWANVLGADSIVRIDPASGRVTAFADASGLLTPAEAAAADVLNGIAYDPERRVYHLTGKLWPRRFVVRFVSRPAPRP
jgi:glutaminyl-peptide cyclotransferase